MHVSCCAALRFYDAVALACAPRFETKMGILAFAICGQVVYMQ